MFCVINHIPVVPEHREAFELRFEASLKHMDGVKGFVRADVWRPGERSRPEGTYPASAYMIQTFWSSEEDFRGWIGSPSFRASHASPMPEEWKAGEAMMSQHSLALSRTAS